MIKWRYICDSFKLMRQSREMRPRDGIFLLAWSKSLFSIPEDISWGFDFSAGAAATHRVVTCRCLCMQAGVLQRWWRLLRGEEHSLNSHISWKEAAQTVNWVCSQSILTHKWLAVNYYAINYLINEYSSQHLLCHAASAKLCEIHVITVTEM